MWTMSEISHRLGTASFSIRMQASRWASITLVAVLYLALSHSLAFPFAGEDPITGGPWYHEWITIKAAESHGIDPAVAAGLAWNADFIDSYLYNPVFWAQGGIDRYKVSVATRNDLARLHFDDLFDSKKVMHTWKRYVTGTFAGLMWAWENDDVPAAQNLLGVSLHAIQDFYAHSSWVDEPSRRTSTWFSFQEPSRSDEVIWTGAYEENPALGIKHHGKIGIACSVLNNIDLLEYICADWTPFGATTLCTSWRECNEGATTVTKVVGLDIPENAVYFSPPGIALDAIWMSGLAAEERGVSDVTGEELFTVARDLAVKSSVQWLKILHREMSSVGAGEFWAKVLETPVSLNARERQYENYAKFPYQFLSAGPYPPTSSQSANEYYLRVHLETGTESTAGTDADIYLHAENSSFLLDYMPDASPILAYNDFESGDKAAYIVGPFSEVPNSIRIENRDASTGDVLEALWDDTVDAVEYVVETVGDFFLSLIGGKADYVDSGKVVWSNEELAAIGSAGETYSVVLDGGSEGKFRIEGTIKRLSAPNNPDEAGAQIRVRVKVGKLYCIEESSVDAWSTADEPFVLSSLVPLPGGTQKWRSKAFDDVDDGDSRNLNHQFNDVVLPSKYGQLVLAFSILESDQESQEDRDDLLDTFAGTIESQSEEARDSFLKAAARAFAPDWKLDRIQVYAFSRGSEISAGTVYDASPNTWIAGSKSKTFQLKTERCKNTGVNSSKLMLAPQEWLIYEPGMIVVPTPDSPDWDDND